jgi:hypothetical protein
MADQTKRGGQKKGAAGQGNSQEHQGVRPGSTSQNKKQPERPGERPGGNSSRVGKGPSED